TDENVVIDAATGAVTATIDGSPLRRLAGPLPGDAWLNGITYLPDSGTFLLTGKLWPSYFEVRFVLAQQDCGGLRGRGQVSRRPRRPTDRRTPRGRSWTRSWTRSTRSTRSTCGCRSRRSPSP